MGYGFLFKSHSDYQFVDLFILSPEFNCTVFFFFWFLSSFTEYKFILLLAGGFHGDVALIWINFFRGRTN